MTAPPREQQWKCGNEFAPYHPQASHVSPDYRDGWNACYEMAHAFWPRPAPSAEPPAQAAPDADRIVHDLQAIAIDFAGDHQVDNTCRAAADPIAHQARELAAARADAEQLLAAIRAISIRGPDGDGLVWIVCTMPNGNAGAISVRADIIAGKVFTAWREASQAVIDAAKGGEIERHCEM